MTQDTMTLREFVDLSLEVEEDESEDDAAKAALIGVLAILRTVIQGGRDIATNDGIAASALKWTEQNGVPTIDSVRAWVYALGVVDRPIPMDFIIKVMEAD